MRKKLAPVAAVLAVSGLCAAAADVFTDYGIERDNWSTGFLSALMTSEFYVPSVPAKLKSLPEGQRAAVVTALGAAARLYIGTPEFQQKYKEDYLAALPDDLKPPRSAKEIADEMKKEMQEQIAEMEKAIKSMPPEMQNDMKGGLEAIKSQMGEMDELAAMQAAEEKARYSAAKSRKPDPKTPLEDPNAGLKRGLSTFLAITSGVDYAAELKTENGRKVFANADFEAKPAAWKACFRAGKDTCDAARQVASAWLNELK